VPARGEATFTGRRPQTDGGLERAVLDAVHEAITVQEPDGRLLWANDAAARLIGFETAEALLSAPIEGLMAAFEVFDEQGNPLAVADLPGRHALAGEDPPEVLLRYRVVATGEERYSMVKARPVFDDRGGVRFAVNVFRDVTQQQLALDALRASEARLAFISANTPKLLAASVEYTKVLERIADVVVPELADYCSIIEVGNDGSLRRALTRHADPTKTDLVERLLEYPLGGGGDQLKDMLSTGEPLLFPDIPEELLHEAAQDEEHLRLILAVGMRSVIAVPLTARGRVLGALALVTAESGRRYGDGDLVIAQDVARRAGLSLDNARLYQERSQVAETLRRSLLPPGLPEIPGIELGARYLAATEEVGGDFYDVFPRPDGRWMVVIGDVVGKGPEAAALTSMVRYTLRTFALEGRRPAKILDAVNQTMLGQIREGQFCSVACALLDPGPEGAKLSLSVAGHPLPLVRRSGGEVSSAGREGTLLGIVGDPTLEEEEIPLSSGESIAFFTDGALTEPDSRTLTAEDRLSETMASGGDSAETLAEALVSTALETRLPGREDDIAILVLRVV
jgi:PAS domain S-box-containing protein